MKAHVLLTTSMFALCLSPRLFAQSDDGGDFEMKPQTSAIKKEDPKAMQEQWDRTVKGLTRIAGSMPMYIRKKDLLVEVPDTALGKLFLVQATLETGVNSSGLQAGDPIGDLALDVFRWEKQDDQILLMRPNLKYRWDKDDPLKAASERSFPEALLGAFRQEAYNPETKTNLINISKLVYGDTFHFNEMVNTLVGGQYVLDREHSSIEEAKGFDANMVVKAKFHYMAGRGGGDASPILALFGLTSENQLEDDRSLPIRLAFNFWYRGDDGYRPRLADPRVGYFTQDFYSLDKFLTPDRTERYVMRFNLRKKDPAKTLSEPVKPIVWTLDPSIPSAYRDAVRTGILRWNQAFEQAGFLNAIRVQDPPADYDHADGRFNVIRWTVSPNSVYAVSNPRVDPFTGEILNASITFDANYLAWIQDEHQNVITPTSETAKAASKALLRHPQIGKITAEQLIYEPQQALNEQKARETMAKFGWKRLECEAPSGLAERANFGYNALLSAPGIQISKEEYAKEFIADTIAHEVGHCLGLRHNFEGSAYLSTADLADDAITSREGITASVMDYTPVNVMAVLKGHGNFFSNTVGIYDRWAIEYGYTPVPSAQTPLGERPALLKIAGASAQPGHAYMTDENVNRWDPYVVMYDCGKDPVNYSGQMLRAARREREYAIERLPMPGENYDRRTKLVLQSILETFREGRYSARFIGGIRGSRSFAGDAGASASLVPVDPAVQRQALQLIVQNCFQPGAVKLTSKVLQSLTFSPDSEESANWTAPVRQIVAALQDQLYAQVMSADTTDRVVENQFKLGGQAGVYTIQEHFGSILGAVFREIGQNRNIDPARRDLQRFAVYALTIQAGAPVGEISEDVRTLANDSLRRLSARMGDQLKKPAGIDEITQTHLRDTKADIDRFLSRQEQTR